MHIEDFRDFCLSLPGTTDETPFGPDTLVFKVGSKIFALTDLQTLSASTSSATPNAPPNCASATTSCSPAFT
ncbi:MAG: MmcQ/YjbR family DNA-binding protein [Hymenobacter sp.]